LKDDVMAVCTRSIYQRRMPVQ